MGGLWACLESLFGMDCVVHGYISGMGGAEHFPAFGAFSENHLLALQCGALREAIPYHFSCFFIKFINGL